MSRQRTPSSKNIDGDEQPPPPPPPLPAKSKKKANNSSKNPYSARGLDKFSTVLGELEARRSRIMEKAAAGGRGDVSMVKFAYSNSSDDWIPLVVRQRRPPDQKGDDGSGETKPSSPATPSPEHAVAELDTAGPLPAAAADKGSNAIGEKLGGLKERMRRRWRDDKGSCYWGLVMVSVLLCAVMFGRVFAICCLLVWWYLVPVVHGEGWIDAKGHGRRTRAGWW